jgi:hypothetical protein
MKLVTVGQRVVFNPKVFKAPYAPYYDAYKDHEFEIVALHHRDTHIELKCVDDPAVLVKGYVHPDELKNLASDTSLFT